MTPPPWILSIANVCIAGKTITALALKQCPETLFSCSSGAEITVTFTNASSSLLNQAGFLACTCEQNKKGGNLAVLPEAEKYKLLPRHPSLPGYHYTVDRSRFKFSEFFAYVKGYAKPQAHVYLMNNRILRVCERTHILAF